MIVRLRPVIDAEATLPVVLDSLLKLGPQPDEYVFADESTYSFPAILERFPARKTVMRTRQADGSYREEGIRRVTPTISSRVNHSIPVQQ